MWCKATLSAALTLYLPITLAAAAQPEALTLTSQFIIHSRPLSPPAGTPPASASVLLVPGSNGVLGLSANGDVQELQQNFLIRSGYRFLSNGLNVAMLDAAPTFPHPNGVTNQRHTQQNADLLAKAVETIQARWVGMPVWLVGTSNSTISVVNMAARYANSQLSLKGIVLTSAVTLPDTSPGGEHHDVINLNPGLGSIKVPTLVIWHKSDDCPVGPAARAGAILTALTNVAAANKGEVVIDKGGWVAMQSCSALGFHGYSGAEDEVVAVIAKFIAAHP
jgi:pimeloyl-ACP methyl ester carboxylesterase